MDHTRVLELVHYDLSTGIFTRRTTNGTHKAGKVLARRANRGTSGYARVRLDGQLFYAHRLAWFYVTGQWPTKQIDHVNGDRLDNRFCNLREADHAEQQQNAGKAKNNTTGYTGVTFHKQMQKYAAQIKLNRKSFHLGCFETAEAASVAYTHAKQNLHKFNPTSPARDSYIRQGE